MSFFFLHSANKKGVRPVSTQRSHADPLNATQVYETPRLPWSPDSDAFHFDAGNTNYGMLPGDCRLNRPYPVWSELQSGLQLGHPGIHDPNTALEAVKGMETVTPERSHMERLVLPRHMNGPG